VKSVAYSRWLLGMQSDCLREARKEKNRNIIFVVKEQQILDSVVEE
jgi:hypothetical protein